MSGIKQSFSLQQNARDVEKSVGDAANGSAVRVAPLAQGGVATAALGIVLNGDTGPVVHGITQPSMGGKAHDDDASLATPLGHWCDAGQRPQRRIIAPAEGPRSLGKQRGQVNPTDPGQRENRHIVLLTAFKRGAEFVKLPLSVTLLAIDKVKTVDERADVCAGRLRDGLCHRDGVQV